jgi:hypothetical protein
VRAPFGALLALLLAFRLLSPAGFMPSFDHGSVRIVPCPAYAGSGAAPAHQHHGGKELRQICPYAAAPAVGPAPGGAPLIAQALPAEPRLQPGRALLNVARVRKHDRPAPRGPPLAA